MLTDIFRVLFRTCMVMAYIIFGAANINDAIRAYELKKWLRFGISLMFVIVCIFGIGRLYFC